MTRGDYDKLQAELAAIERAHPDARRHGSPIYLADESIDAENVPEGMSIDDPEYWSAMYRAACSAAGSRAEEYGLDLNALMGRAIY